MTSKKSKRKQTRLNDKHKVFVVQQLAAFMSPKEVSDALMETFGVKLAPQNIEHYDPTKYAGKALAQRWIDLFDISRKAFLNHIETKIPEANKAVRIKELARASREFRQKGNFIAMADMFERIAKEMGNVHTNRREFTGKGGGPIQYQELTDDQIDARLRELMAAEAIDSAPDGSGQTKH